MAKKINIEFENSKSKEVDLIVTGADCMELFQELKVEGFNPTMSSQYEFKVRIDKDKFKELIKRGLKIEPIIIIE